MTAVPTPESVLDLLKPDGRAWPPEGESPTGLADAISTLDDKELRQDVAAGLYTYAMERLDMAEHAEERAKYIPAEEFRARALVKAERLARLWREAVRAT